MSIFSQENEKLICRIDGETIWFCPWGKNSIRILSSFMKEPELTDWALLPSKAEGNSALHFVNEGRTAVLSVGKLKVVIQQLDWPNRVTFAFYNQKDELLFREAPRGGALALSPRKFKPIIGGDYRLTASFEGDEQEKLYGMGQYQQEIMDLKGCTLELAHRNSQASIPFVLSSKGYGFFWHNPAVGRVNFSRNVTQWHAESTKQLDYWVTAGDTPAEIEEAYADATGKVPMMPEYGMGFWQCKLRYWNQNQLLEAAREYKRRRLPLDVIVCDFFHWPKMGDYRFDEEFFPDPKAMTDELEAMGVKLMVSVWPQVDVQSENYAEMQEQGLLIRPEAGMNISMGFGGYSNFFDATNPRARAYVWGKCKKNYYDKGIPLFWLDEAEPEFGVYDYDNYRCALGPYVQVGNVYPQMYSRTFYDGRKQAGEEKVVNLVRCAWAGSQRYGALVWSGDIHSDFSYLRRQICAGLHMGIAGIPWWTTDIGGFSDGDPKDPTFRELLVRWFQYGTFCPVMRLHGDRRPDVNLFKQDGTPALFTGADNEVWSFGDEAYPILKKYLEFRETMRPYIREIMTAAHEKGTPVMRTLFYEFPGDAQCWDVKDEYLFGGDVLVAPVTEAKAAIREVYLPAGEQWTDLHTGAVFEGGSIVTAATPISYIPIYLRGHSHADWIGQL